MALSLASLPVPTAPADRPAADGAGVIFRGAVYGGSGYADGNQDVLNGLLQRGVRVQLAPIGLQRDERGLLPSAQQRAYLELQARRLDPGRSIFYQCCPPPDFDTRAAARVRVGRAAFETDSLPGGWAASCNAMDQVWVPSRFNRESFQRGGVDAHRLRVMPEGLDTRRFRPGLTPLPLPERRGFTFLSVFDWIDRKGWDVLLRAYTAAFGPDDPVTLLLKIHKFDEPGADLENRLLMFLERELGVAVERAPRIVVLSGLLPAASMPRLYNSADAFVLASRGEGWGRPYMEAAASQLPVLATRWGGQLDFLHDGNSFLIDLEGVAPAPRDSDREIYIGQGWAEPSAGHLAELMRRVVADRQEARRRARQARADMAEKWDTRVLAPLWADAVQSLLR